MLKHIKANDPEIFNAISLEMERQENHIELIASENFTSKAVMEACGSQLTNKYAEGYPNKRYYGGCEYVDLAETLAIDRMKKLYNADHANVQPHSGSQANMGVYFAVLKPGDKVMGMDLSHGGHLTHGAPVNFSGQLYNFVSYSINEEGYIDYDAVEAMAIKEQPKMIVAGASAYPRAIDFKRFKEIADKVDAYFMVDMAHIAGLVAAGLHQSPVPYADFVTTTTHKTLRGPRGGAILCKEKYIKAINKVIFPGIQGGPLMHTIAGKAVCFLEALQPEFKAYQEQVIKNAKALAAAFIERGFDLVSGGTDNHLMLLDLRNKGLNGKEAENLLDDLHITTNKNTVPNETESPFVTSGLRIGTPAVTTRGFKEEDMVEIAAIIDCAIENRVEGCTEAKARVAALCKKYPLYQD